MSNQEVLAQHVKSLGYELGCCNGAMDKLTKSDLNKVMQAADEECTDVWVHIGRKKYAVEISTVDGEKDFSILSESEYQNRYGTDYLEQ